MLNIAIADDHLLFSQGLREILSCEPHFNIVGITRNGADLITLIDSRPVDLAIIDLKMPVMDGMSACKRIRAEYPRIKIIVLSMFAESLIATQLRSLGVHGYTFKDMEGSEIIRCIHSVIAGKSAYTEINDYPPSRYYFANTGGSVPGVLSAREIEITSLIKRGYTSEKIARRLFISLNTVKQHRKHILKKLRLNNAQELVSYAIYHEIN